MPRKLVTLEDITLMNELYKQIGTYAGVARQVGFSASTVAKYIQKDYIPKADIKIKKFSSVIPKNTITLPASDKKLEWKKLFSLSEQEIAEINELRMELSI